MRVGLSIPMNRADWVYLFKRVVTPWVPRLEDENVPWGDMEVVEMSDSLCRVYADAYPVTDGHLLFVPVFEDAATIAYAMRRAVEHGLLMRRDDDWDGFNAGLNHGAAAGQTVWWSHVHLIPRRKGDMVDPRGGIRHVIPSQGNYHTEGYKLPIC